MIDRRLLYTLSGIGAAALLSSCGSKDQVLSPLANGAAGSIAAVGDTANNMAGDTASTLANEARTAAPATKPTPSSEPFSLRNGEQIVNHRISSGDTLSRLAKTYGTRISRIQAANNMTGTKIILGKTLKIPTSQSVANAPRPTESAPVPPSAAAPSFAPAPPAAAPSAAPAAAPSGFSGFSNPALADPRGPAPAPAPAAPSAEPVAPAPAPAPAVPAPNGLPSFSTGGLQIQD